MGLVYGPNSRTEPAGDRFGLQRNPRTAPHGARYNRVTWLAVDTQIGFNVQRHHLAASAAPRKVADLDAACVKQPLKFVAPVAVGVVALVQDLEAKSVVLEFLRELLPRDLAAGFLEKASHGSLVGGVFVSLQMRTLAVEHKDAGHRLTIVVPLLDDEVRINRAAAIALNGEILRADQISILPKHLRMGIDHQRHASF